MSAKICPACKKQFDGAEAFCDNCGAALVDAQPAQPNYQQPAQPNYQQPPVQPGY